MQSGSGSLEAGTAAASASASRAAEDDERTAQIWRELVENSVECELCNEPYDDDDGEDGRIPRLLSCGHTFCQSCLEDWSSVGASHAGAGGAEATVDCPTCRRATRYDAALGARALPKNYELVRVRQEMEAQTQAQLRRLKEAWNTQVWEKEQLALEAEEHARTAQRESVQASQRALFLAKQVEINEQEKKRAQELAEEARHRALVASQQAEALQAETESLKRQLQSDAAQLARVQHDASSAAAVAAELHSKAEQLQQQVDCVRAQLSLHAGRHDPSKLVVLVCEPTTVGSWLLPYTRYAVISIASDSTAAIDPFQAAKTWTQMRQVAEPSSSVKVYRRYSDFVWLQRELTRQFPFALVPCVPGKQLFFNKEKEFVGERMRLLQAFLRGVLRLPQLAVTEEVRAFLLSTTEELDSLRRASSAYYSSADGDDALLDDDTLDDDAATTSPPPAPSSTSSSLRRGSKSSSWSAWGAVSALTSSAAKLVTTTGTALSASVSSQSGAAPLDDTETPLSSSLTLEPEQDHRDEATRACAARRRKYVEVARAYTSVAHKGSQLSRAARQQSHHLHRMCELLHEMNTLDQSHARRRRQRLAASEDLRRLQPRHAQDEDDLVETRAFDERASEAFSAISLATKNNADCMEYALLEVVRMQTLELGAVEAAFARVRSREDALEEQAAGTTPTSASLSGSTSSNAPTSSALLLRREELETQRRELGEKVAALDPQRSRFVLDTLRQNAGEMHKLAKTKRKLFQASQQQLAGVGPVCST